MRWVVDVPGDAVVGQPETKVEGRQRDHHEERHRAHQDQQRPARDERRPAQPHGPALRLAAALGTALDAAPEHPEPREPDEGRQERQRDEHGHRDGHGRRDAHLGQERDAHHGQP